jgi:hypothetical protein
MGLYIIVKFRDIGNPFLGLNSLKVFLKYLFHSYFIFSVFRCPTTLICLSLKLYGRVEK